jgi:hypothetical protein
MALLFTSPLIIPSLPISPPFLQPSIQLTRLFDFQLEGRKTMPSPPPPTYPGLFSYFSPQPYHSLQKPYEIIPSALPSPCHPHSNLTFENRICNIEDVRGREAIFSLDTHGFAFRRHETCVVNLKDEAEIEQRYREEIEELVKRELGGSVRRVHVFGWKVGWFWVGDGMGW